jgi:hypothetical protein
MQLRKPKPKQTPFVSNWTVIAILLALLLSGCAMQQQQPPSSPILGVRLQPLPQSARQGNPPPESSPTFSAWLTKQRESWQKLLTEAAWPDSSAKDSTTRE